MEKLERGNWRVSKKRGFDGGVWYGSHIFDKVSGSYSFDTNTLFHI